MVTTLGYALLGLLAREPSSGYDLAQQLRKPIGFYWQARHSQIYPELARLEANGLATFEVVQQTDLPTKKVYTITPAGMDALRQWVITPPDVPTLRDELILRAFSVWVADPEATREVFRTHEQHHLDQLHEYEGFEQELLAEYGVALNDPTSPGFAAYATLKGGIAYEHMYLEWCRWMQQQLGQAEKT